MSAHELITIQRTFQQCLKDISIFERSDTDGHFFEVNDIQIDRKRWLVIAAGIDQREANELFVGNPKRAQNSLTPLQYRSSCKVCILFILRPFEQDPRQDLQTILLSPFSPSRRIPWVEIRRGYVRILDIPDNENKLLNMRWEWETVPYGQDPIEKWLRLWKADCGSNPAHPPSHLHINSVISQTDEKSLRKPGDLEKDLRLAIGTPNPLAFLLSIAVWLQKL